MQPATSSQGQNLQFAVIGRLNKEHDAYSLTSQQIREHIAYALIIPIDPSDIIHIPPNFIIQLDNAHVQEAVLAAHPLLHTNYFQLEILPWSKEHECCQIPWISEYGSETSDIIIDPLTILPVISSASTYKGNSKLKDTFASKIPKNYDLRAPSFLLIAELRPFYYMKFNIFMKYKDLIITIHNAIHDFYPTINRQISDIYSYIQSLRTLSAPDMLPHVYTFALNLKNIALSMDTTIANIDEIADRMLKDTRPRLNLEGFKQGPPSSQIPVPPEYASRLKTIFVAAIQKIHRTNPILETVETQEHTFETYVTIGNFTRKYSGGHEKSAASMEADAIFYSLKHISNVLGYRVIDLNYPTLALMVADIDTWNRQINRLQFLQTLIVNQTKQFYEQIEESYQEINFQPLNHHHFQHLTRDMSALFNMCHNYCSSIKMLSQNCDYEKRRYTSARIDTYSPSRSYYRWARAKRPQKTTDTI